MRRDLTLHQDDAPIRRLHLAPELAAERRPAKAAAARIQAAALAAHTGLICIEALSALEVQAVKRQGAVLDARAKAVVDSYTGLVTAELAMLAIGG